MNFEVGVQFSVVALQAVMTALLEGDTIHHALGIPCFGRKGQREQGDRSMEVAKRVLQLRWLIIDEISMVSAKLLATIDMKLRSVVRVLGTQKKAQNSVERSFGGAQRVNVR